MQVLNQTGNASQKSRILKELQGYSLRIQKIRIESQKVLNNLRNSIEKNRAGRIGAVALSNGSERHKDAR